jgi:hypothetical protein
MLSFIIDTLLISILGLVEVSDSFLHFLHFRPQSCILGKYSRMPEMESFELII